MIKIFVLLLIYALFACAQVTGFLSAAQVVDVAVLKSVSGVYCNLPQWSRELNRSRWNAAIYPNSIALTCAGDIANGR